MDCQYDWVVNNLDLIHFVARHKEGVLMFVFVLPMNIVAVSIDNNSASCHHIHFVHYHNSSKIHLIIRFIRFLRIKEELFVFCLNCY